MYLTNTQRATSPFSFEICCTTLGTSVIYSLIPIILPESICLKVMKGFLVEASEVVGTAGGLLTTAGGLLDTSGASTTGSPDGGRAILSPPSLHRDLDSYITNWYRYRIMGYSPFHNFYSVGAPHLG